MVDMGRHVLEKCGLKECCHTADRITSRRGVSCYGQDDELMSDPEMDNSLDNIIDRI